MPARIEALAMAAGMPQAAVHSQLASAVDAVIHVVRGTAGRRRVAEVAVLTRTPSGLVEAAPAVTFAEDGSHQRHAGAAVLAGRLGDRLGELRGDRRGGEPGSGRPDSRLRR